MSQHARVRKRVRVRVGLLLLMFAAASGAAFVSGSFVPSAAAEPHSIMPPWWTWWNRPGLCAHVVSGSGANPVLAQSIARDDHQRHATLHVSVYSTVAVQKPQFVSCAFVDRDGNGVLSRNERLTGHVVHATPLGPNAFEYDRQLVADPQTSVCVVTAVFEHSEISRYEDSDSDGAELSAPLSSNIGCVVNPAPMVPEAPVPVLLGVVSVGVLGGFGLVCRRKTRQAVS
jgi:hypothetical protein